MMFVRCRECDEQHQQGEVEALDVESDFEGRDMLIFKCPETGKETTSLIFNS